MALPRPAWFPPIPLCGIPLDGIFVGREAHPRAFSGVNLRGPMKADFYERKTCIACQSENLRTLDSGKFGEEPHRSMFLQSPWGESPLPFLEDCDWALVQCEVCEIVFHAKVLTPEWTERRFSKWMSEEAIQQFQLQNGVLEPQAVFTRTRRKTDHILCIEKMTRGLRGDQATRLLDFGCGSGEFLTLAETFGFDVHGVDRSTARTENFQGKAPIYQNLEQAFEQNAAPIHAATLFEVLEHLEDPVSILQSIHQRLVPSGALIVEVPNAAGVTQIKTNDDLVIDGFDHLNGFTPSTLKRMVQKAGFRLAKRPTAHVAADGKKIIKREIRRLVGPFRKPSTQLYFRRA